MVKDGAAHCNRALTLTLFRRAREGMVVMGEGIASIKSVVTGRVCCHRDAVYRIESPSGLGVFTLWG